MTALFLLVALQANLPQKLVEGARQQLSWGTVYDPSYRKIRYPNGDVPRAIGVCTDVVIRAYRHAGVDLQERIHEDIRRRRSAYPKVKRPDPNIDHRRVPNQIVFFMRHGRNLSIRNGFLAGDLVAWKLPNGRDHIGILSDRKSPGKHPLVIHNIGPAPAEEDVLFTWKIVGHYRYP